MSYSIHAIEVGVLHNHPQAAITYKHRWGTFQDIPFIVFAILGGDAPIIVDTGAGSPEKTRHHHQGEFEQRPGQRLDVQLEALGVDPNAVKTVISTHLHWDHCGNNDLFPNANILVQTRELEYAVDPAQPFRNAYDLGKEKNPTWMETRDRIIPVDGDEPIADGISLVHLPGHTPGSQGVLVDTGERRYLIAGDCVGSYANWHRDGQAEPIPSGAFINLDEYMDSFKKIRMLDCEVIPSHDAEVVRLGVFK